MRLITIAFLSLLMLSCSESLPFETPTKTNTVSMPALSNAHYQIPEETAENYIEMLERTAEQNRSLFPLATLLKTINMQVKELNQEIEDLKWEMVEKSGGYYVYQLKTKERLENKGYVKLILTEDPDKDGQLVDGNNKRLVKTYLVEDGVAAKWRKRMRQILKDFKEGYMTLAEQNEDVEMNRDRLDALVLELEELLGLNVLPSEDPWRVDLWEGAKLKLAVKLMNRMQTDMTLAEIGMIRYLIKERKPQILLYDRFEAVAFSETPYILLGETYEAELALGAYSSQVDISVAVNGRMLKVEEGKAVFKTRPSSVGEQRYMASFTVKNPLTGDVESFEKEFRFQVGVPSITASLDKMNVIYIGVDNPISVAAAGVPSNDLQAVVVGGGVRIKGVGKGKYILNATKKGICELTFKNRKTGKTLGTYTFRVKSIPTPQACLANKKMGGIIKAGEMRAQAGLLAILDDFDFDARCLIQSYTLYYAPARQDPIEIKNMGGQFSGKTLNAIQSARPGAVYLFNDVKGRCPGDTSPRKLNSLAFVIR